MSIPSSIEQYKRDIKNIISKNSLTVFPCKGEEQSRFVTSLLLDNTQKEIFIFSKSLDADLSTESNKSLEDYMSRKGKIYLLLDKMPENGSVLFEKISAYLENKPERGDIKQTTCSSRKIITESFKQNKYSHFVVSDENKYKLEINSFEQEFLCSFHHRKLAKKLSQIFSQANPLANSKLHVLDGI